MDPVGKLGNPGVDVGYLHACTLYQIYSRRHKGAVLA